MSAPFLGTCKVVLGAAFTQGNEDGKHIIVYFSRTRTKAECNYTTSEKECLALVWTIKRLRLYLDGYHFPVITTNISLR